MKILKGIGFAILIIIFIITIPVLSILTTETETDNEREVMTMFCGRCGADDEKTFVKSGFVETVDEVYYYRVGKCTQCGELLGTKEVYTFDHCEEMSREEAKKLLTNGN